MDNLWQRKQNPSEREFSSIDIVIQCGLLFHFIEVFGALTTLEPKSATLSQRQVNSEMAEKFQCLGDEEMKQTTAIRPSALGDFLSGQHYYYYHFYPCSA